LTADGGSILVPPVRSLTRLQPTLKAVALLLFGDFSFSDGRRPLMEDGGKHDDAKHDKNDDIVSPRRIEHRRLRKLNHEKFDD
jgi:hypothetical protein